MLVEGDSIVSFVNSPVLVSGGGLKFRGTTQVTIDDSSISITEGDLQFAGESSVVFTNSPVYLSGQLEFIGNANTHFKQSDITIESGSFHAKDHSNVFFEQCNIDIGGSLHAQNDADVRIEDSRITIDNGDVRVNDQGSFAMHKSSLVITSGNFIATNPGAERKYLSFVNSVVSVERSSGNVLNGHMEINENVEVSLLASDVVVDGDLVLTGSARLNIFEESSFTIPSGVVEMAVTSSIIIDGSSSLLNQGQLVAPGSLRVPGDSSMSNEGLLESSHDFNANCFADLANGAPLANSGIFSMGSADASHPLQTCVDNMHHSGLMQLGNTNMTFNLVQTTQGSTITLAGATVSVSSNDEFSSEGTLGGTGSFTGSFTNNRDGQIMSNGETGATRLTIEDNFSSSGTMFFSINSRDLSLPGAITQINAGRNVALDGGRACICFNPALQFDEDDKFDLVNAAVALNGRFDDVEFGCVECPRRSAKSVEGEKDACEPSADYSGANFSVLFNGCNSGDGGVFDAVSPPWYVIFPVAVTIVIIIVIVFGGGLYIEGRIRKKRFENKVARKRSARVNKLMKDTKKATMSASSSSMM